MSYRSNLKLEAVAPFSRHSNVKSSGRHKKQAAYNRAACLMASLSMS